MSNLVPRLIDQFLVAVPESKLTPLQTLEHLKGSGAAGLCIGLDTVTDRASRADTIAESAHEWRSAATEVGTAFGAVWVSPPADFARHAWFSAPDAPTRRAAIADLIAAVDCAAVLGAKTVRADLAGETAPLGVDVPQALDHVADSVNAALAYALAQEVEIELSLRVGGSLFGSVGGAIAWISDLDFEEMVGLELDIATVAPLDLGAALWHDKLFSINVNGLVAGQPVSAETLWAVAQLEDAEWSGWRAVSGASGAAPEEWGASAGQSATRFLEVQDAARDFLAEDAVISATNILNGPEDSEPTLPNGRSIEALAGHRAARDPRVLAPEESAACEDIVGALDRWRTA